MNENLTFSMKLRKYTWGFFWRLFRIRQGKMDPIELTIYLQKYFAGLSMEELQIELARTFRSRNGETLDLEKPVTFNQKIQWLKLYEATEEKTRLSDKSTVRPWVEQKIGNQYLVPCLGVWDRYEDIPFQSLPNRFALKCTSGSGMNHIVHDKDKLDYNALKCECDRWLRRNYGYTQTAEIHYRPIVPRIMAEEYLENAEGDLYDYKVHCFAGEPKCIQVIQGRFGTEAMEFYDPEWKMLGFKRKNVVSLGKTEPPKELDELLRLARELSEGFTYVRVDFYVVNDRIYFGEMTFTPAAGFTPWEDQNGNNLMGSWLKLPKETAR